MQSKGEDNSLPKSGVRNGFNTIEPRNVYENTEQSRLIPRQMISGVSRGQQSVGSNRVLIDSENVRFTIKGEDEQATIFFGYVDDFTDPLLVIGKDGFNVFESIQA